MRIINTVPRIIKGNLAFDQCEDKLALQIANGLDMGENNPGCDEVHLHMASQDSRNGRRASLGGNMVHLEIER